MGTEVPIRRVESIEFGILSPEDIVGISVCKIEHPETMESGTPKEGGLIDLRLGTSERGFLCSTCGHRSDDCPGHFGYIELAKPVFHIGFLGKIKKVLESVCFFCSKLRIEKAALGHPKPRSQKERKRRLNLVWGLAKNRAVCLGEAMPSAEDTPEEKLRTGCENRQPTIRKEGLHLLAFQKGEESSEGKTVLSAEKALEILRRIPEEDIEALGFDLEKSRPEWMIIRTLPVPPPQVRPSIVMEGSLRCEDDLTHKLADIIKASNNLRRYEQEGAPGHIIRDYEQLLQFHVATLMNNDISGQPQSLQKNGRPLKSIRARLRGKEGRVRGNLMGKRVDFSARTVITADPNISMNEVGVPEEVAKMLTFPEKVTEYNLEEARRAVHRGPHKHPGAKYVIRDDGQRIDLRFHKGDLNVQVGYVVERHLRNGDIVLFNRQPSLHKMSMMAHRAKVMKFSTFRLNLSVTSPYNADFDGDEMNLHLPQSVLAQTELRELALVEKNIVSPQSNRPVMGVVQDTLTGVYKLTRRDVFFTRAQMMGLAYAIDNGKPLAPPVILRPARLYSGKQVFSHTLPQVTYSGLHSTHVYDSKLSSNAADTVVIIKDGELLAGTICKKSVGTSSGGLIHVIANDFPRNICVDFIDSLQRAITTWLMTSESFSVGIGDTVADPSTMDTIKEAIDRAKGEVHKIIKRAETNKLERLPGMSMRESFETAVTLALNKARDTSGTSAQKSLCSLNNIKQMVVSGSKGSFINISQMSACVGQQSVEGKRILFGFRNRSLPHFTKDDYGPESRGFVSNSYISGLVPEEFFFHAMGGREGLIDTAVKTAETGYIQRRLVKALEDAQVRHDKSVRDGEGNVLQCAYGGDCIDATFIEMQKLALFCSDEEFERTFAIDHARVSEYAVSTRVATLLRTPKVRAVVARELRELKEERERLLKNYTDGKKPLPVALSRILYTAQRMSQNLAAVPGVVLRSGAASGRAGKGDVLPEDIVTARESLEQELLQSVSAVPEIAESAFALFRTHLRGYITIKRVLCEFQLSTQAFEWAVERIRTLFLKSIVSAGEMVGTLAAQSVGEPATQMTLNTFHLAGVASTVTRGVPRLKEIINVARTIKTPSLTVYLRDDLRYSLEGAKRAQQEIERCHLRDLLDRTEIIYDPALTAVKQDADFIETYAILDPSIYTPASPWALRLILNRGALVDKGMSIQQIAARVEKAFGFMCMHSDENASVQVIRCQLSDTEDKLRKIESAVSSLMLKGLTQIKRVFINETKTGERTEYILQTEGTGLAEVLSHPFVDASRTVSNDPLEMYAILGVEAARTCILNEIRAVIESDGSYVNFRHLSILADVMTQRGILCGITRHGTNRGDSGALMRCSFEETVEILLDAAANAEIDRCKGVVESVMLGQVASIGTGITDVLMDKDSLEMGIMAMEKYEFEDEDSGDKTPPDFASPSGSGYSEMSPYASQGGSPGFIWSPQVDSGYSPDASGGSGMFGYSPTSPGPASPSPYGGANAYTPMASYSFGYPGFSPSSPQNRPGSSSPIPTYAPLSPSRGYVEPYTPGRAFSPSTATLYMPAPPTSRREHKDSPKRLWKDDEKSESSDESFQLDKKQKY
ncbi:DNA-directed RNA polymerase II subunit RPB1 [Nematocida displodere]|uniref:DNA-directed RNA polymerase subunit n=1 Tax=Nematocida displodere TaxID=1805483 RepID=A0A177EBT0_9MICR|nr:DNA-directed RNA polymerase II subunit RPB1 [Nematocida displodere]